MSCLETDPTQDTQWAQGAFDKPRAQPPNSWPARSQSKRRYRRCVASGEHARLTDCWLCWSDVQRGELLVAEALRADPQTGVAS